ncbi:MAG: RluA family pseudouridine synthase [Rectinemataceae bacterium]|nr:RluA family pseudouridine synthase [Rectinemataceae bacterium]
MNIELPILFADESLLAVDKPSGIFSVPDRYDPDASVALNILAPVWGRLHVIHRIDKDTSGVLIYCRDEAVHRSLNGAFGTGAVVKTYHALVRGAPDWDEASCEFPLHVDADKQHRTVIDAHHGKESRTNFRVLARYRGRALIEARPETGRVHQVRVHLAAVGFPVIGDPFYGDGKPLMLSSIKRGWKGDPHTERPLLSRTALHSVSVEFVHPLSGDKMLIEAPYPKDFRASVSQLTNA